LYPPVLLRFSTTYYPFASSCSSLVFDFRLPLCILLSFFGFRLPNTPLHHPVLLWVSTSDYPFVSSLSSLFSTSDYPFVPSNVSYQFMIFAYYFLWCCWFKSRSGRGVQHYLIKFFNDLRQVSPGTPVSSINKADRHDITEILLKVELNTIQPFTISI
jgi:hypothetical protein